jgi:hypothetical protein
MVSRDDSNTWHAVVEGRMPASLCFGHDDACLHLSREYNGAEIYASSSSKALASWRSAVSKPSVNHA